MKRDGQLDHTEVRAEVPPDTDTFSMRNALIASASLVNSSRDNPCKSRGPRIRPRTSN